MSKLISQNVRIALKSENPFHINVVLDRFINITMAPKHKRQQAHPPILSLSKDDARELVNLVLTAMGQVAIVWSVDDVTGLTKHKSGGYLIEDDDAIEILRNLRNNHDANYGVGWDDLHAEIDTCLEYLIDQNEAQAKTRNFLETACIKPVYFNDDGNLVICEQPDPHGMWAICHKSFRSDQLRIWAAFHFEGEAIKHLQLVRKEVQNS